MSRSESGSGSNSSPSPSPSPSSPSSSPPPSPPPRRNFVRPTLNAGVHSTLNIGEYPGQSDLTKPPEENGLEEESRRLLEKLDNLLGNRNSVLTANPNSSSQTQNSTTPPNLDIANYPSITVTPPPRNNTGSSAKEGHPAPQRPNIGYPEGSGWRKNAREGKNSYRERLERQPAREGGLGLQTIKEEEAPTAPPRTTRTKRPEEQSSPPQPIPTPAGLKPNYEEVGSTKAAVARILGNGAESGWNSSARRSELRQRPETQQHVKQAIGRSESGREEALRGESFTERVLRQRERDVNNDGKEGGR